MGFKDKVKKYIVEKELICGGDRVLCALSGGGDSVALLMILAELTEEMDFTLCAAHFHHGIRGEEADSDQKFSESLCRELNVPFFTAREDIPRLARESGKGLEECARERRYAFIFGVAKEQNCTKLATAHHATDNTETVLFHLIRGSGIKGLGGITPKRGDGVIRPLLCVSRTEVEEFLTEREQKFVTDSTNADTDMTRNFIRIRMLPLIKEINPSADRAVLRLSDSAREDEEYFINEAKKLPRGASLGYLKSVPSPILKRYIRLCFEEAVKEGAQLDYGSLEAICGDIRNGVSRFRYSVCGNIAVIGDGGRLEFIADKVTPKPFCFTVDTAGEYRTECGTVFVTEDEEAANAWTDANQRAVFTAYPIDGDGWSFTVRSALPGDRYLRGGMHREVRKELNAFGYPAHKRASLPRFCDGDGIFWVPYLPAGDKIGKAVEKTRTVFSRKQKEAEKAEKEIYKQLIYIGYTEN